MELSTLSEVFAGKAKGIPAIEVPEDVEVKKPGFDVEINLDKELNVLNMKPDLLDIGGLKSSALDTDLSTKMKLPKSLSFDKMFSGPKKTFNVNNFVGVGTKQKKQVKDKFNMLGGMGTSSANPFKQMTNRKNKFNMLGGMSTSGINSTNPFKQMDKRMSKKVGMTFGGAFRNSVSNMENKMFSRAVKDPEGIGRRRLQQQKHLSPLGDWDGDRVMNALDCQPFNPYKQGVTDTVKGWFTKGSQQGGTVQATAPGTVADITQTTEDEELKVKRTLPIRGEVFLGHPSGIMMSPEDVKTTPRGVFKTEAEQLRDLKKLTEMDKRMSGLSKGVEQVTSEAMRLKSENVGLRKEVKNLEQPGLLRTVGQLLHGKTVGRVKGAVQRETLKEAAKSGAIEQALAGSQEPIRDKDGKITGWQSVNPYVKAMQQGEALGAEALYKKELKEQLYSIYPEAKKLGEQFDIKKYGKYGMEYDPLTGRLIRTGSEKRKSRGFFRGESQPLGFGGLGGGSPQRTEQLLGIGGSTGFGIMQMSGAGQQPFGQKIQDVVGLAPQQSGVQEMSSLGSEPVFQQPAPPPPPVQQPVYQQQPEYQQSYGQQPVQQAPGATISPYSGRQVSYIRGPYRKRAVLR